MRSIRRRAAMVGVLGLAAIAWSGCSGKKATELVAGVSSQVQVPRDMKTIVVNVTGQFPSFCQAYPVYDGKVRLPRTLGVVSGGNGDPRAPVTITIAGFTEDVNTNLGAINCLAQPAVGTAHHDAVNDGGGARVLRRSRQPYAQNRIVYVPMPLRFSCYDIDCEQSKEPGCEAGDCTCKGGKCMPPDIDSSALPDYDDNLVFGTSNTCFRPFLDQDASGKNQQGCLDYGIPPQVVDADKCIYALPGSASVPSNAQPYDPNVPAQLIQLANQSESTGAPSSSNLNVRVVYDNFVSEVLDYEGPCPAAGASSQVPVEGYCTFPDAPQKFMIADGICHNPLHKISLMTASAGCPAKTTYQPVCDDSVQGPPQPTLLDGGSSADGGCNVATTLTPAPSALYLMFDRSSGMRDFFGSRALSTVLSLSLSDPAFKQTEVAFKYTPGLQKDCSAAPSQNTFANPSKANGDIPFEPSLQAQQDIGLSLLNQAGPDGGTPQNLPPGTDPWYLESALDGAYTALLNQGKSKKESYNRLAAMLFFNRDFGNDCGAPHPDAIAEAQNALAAAGIRTYVVFLKNADFTSGGAQGIPPQPWIDHAGALAQPAADPNDPTQSTRFFNATGNDGRDPGAVQLQALTQVIADLGSCVYETEPNIGTGATLSFLDVKQSPPATVNATYSATGCAGESDTNPLWVFDDRHIHICPQTCARLVASSAALQAFNLAQNIQNSQNGLPPVATQDITVSAMEPCNPSTPDPPLKEAGVDTGTALPQDSGSTEDSAAPDSAAPADAASGG